MSLYAPSALKIQCSSSAFYLLEEIGGYVLECRGTLQVKVSPPHPSIIHPSSIIDTSILPTIYHKNIPHPPFDHPFIIIHSFTSLPSIISHLLTTYPSIHPLIIIHLYIHPSYIHHPSSNFNALHLLSIHIFIIHHP